MPLKKVRMLLRVSSNQQLEADGDLSVQRRIVKEYIQKQEDWILDEKEYFEGSNSGYNNAVSDRDVLQEALRDAASGQYDILVAYKDLDERIALVETKLSALEMVRRVRENKIGRFNKQDIRELCPTLSDSSIEGALRKMVSDGELKKEGKGKSTCYFRLK